MPLAGSGMGISTINLKFRNAMALHNDLSAAITGRTRGHLIATSSAPREIAQTVGLRSTSYLGKF